MKLISFEQNGSNRIGAIENGFIYDFHSIDSNISDSMLGFLQGGEIQLKLAKKVIKEKSIKKFDDFEYSYYDFRC